MINSPATSTANDNDRDSILQLANENPLGIKIKEITKPEEIRITDDKPKPFNPFKSTTTTTTTTIASNTASLDVTTESEAKSSTESSTITLTTETIKESKELPTEDTNQSPNHGEHDYVDNGVSIDNNSSDAPSPAVKALVEPEVLLNSGADSNSIADDPSNKNVRQIVEHSTIGGDIDQFSDVNDFSSTTELVTESSSPSDASTTENGEEIDLTASSTPQNVVFVRHGGKTESFHISGTDGLQRVEELEVDVSSTTESDNNNNQESTAASNDGGSSRSSEIGSMETTSEPETFDEIGTVSLAIEKKFDKSLNSNASSIDNLSNNSIEVSTLDDGLESSSEFASSEKVYETVYFEGDEKSSTASPSDDTSAFDTVYFPFSSTEDSSESSSTIDGGAESSSSTTDQSTVTATESLSTAKSTFSYEEEQEVTAGENPFYPYIPDDLSIHNKEATEPEEKRRLPNKVLQDTIVSSTAGPPCDDCDDVLKMMEPSSTQGPPDQEIKISHKSDVIESRVPGEPNLIPEWERNTTEKASAIDASTTLGPNDTEINALNKTSVSSESNESKSNQSAALMLETTVASIDSDEKYGRKEPTTERSTTKGYANVNDFDDISSSAQQSENSTTDGASPDDDAESIKLNSSASTDDDTNESYENRPFEIPNSLQNYFRYVSKINDWKI